MMKISKAEIAELIDNFLAGRGGSWDWDDFISVKLDDPELEEIRRVCAEVPKIYPAERKGAYCSDEGLWALRRIRSELQM